MSRGTTRRIAFGRRTRTVPNSSRSVTKTRPSGPPSKPPLRLRSTRVIAPGGGASGAWTTAAGMPGLLEQLGEARRLVRGEDDPGAVDLPALDGLRRSRCPRPAGSCGSRQPNMSPDVRPRRRGRRLRGSDSHVSSSVRRRPAGASTAAARRRSTASPSAARRSRSARRGARRPGATGSRRPRRCRPARRGRGACRARRGRGRSPARGAAPRPPPRRRRSAPATSRSPRTARGRRRGAPAASAALRPSCSASAARTPQELRRGEQGHAAPAARRPAGRSGRTPGASRSRRRRTRSGPAARPTAGRRRRCRRAVRTRRARRPRRRARTRGRAARGGARPAGDAR